MYGSNTLSPHPPHNHPMKVEQKTDVTRIENDSFFFIIFVIFWGTGSGLIVGLWVCHDS